MKGPALLQAAEPGLTPRVTTWLAVRRSTAYKQLFGPWMIVPMPGMVSAPAGHEFVKK